MSEKRYDRECWLCHKQTMVAKGDYYQCSECGATWCEGITLGSYIDMARDKQGPGKSSSFHPVRKSGKGLPPLSDKSKAAKAAARRKGQPIF